MKDQWQGSADQLPGMAEVEVDRHPANPRQKARFHSITLGTVSRTLNAASARYALRHRPAPRRQRFPAALRELDRRGDNLLLVERPNGSYADTLMRQFLFDGWHLLLLGQLKRSSDEKIAAIADKSLRRSPIT